MSRIGSRHSHAASCRIQPRKLTQNPCSRGQLSAGKIEDDGLQLRIMMGMCDMTQFVLVTYVESTLTCDLAPMFMQEMLLKVGFCVVVANDEGGTFKGEFQEMCRILKIRDYVFARANYKGLYVRSKTEV
jgi:hypothetical protein